MIESDILYMNEAIEWAKGCNPTRESIPRVGAVIAVGNQVLGRGRRGTGTIGDDEHAEFHAFQQVKDKAQLPAATLYTTLEPCTPEVRSKPLECCTELILQHEIRKVFIGILDPNQGVTGKGLWRLQDMGVEITLFPHDLAERIRAINAQFIRSQQTLGATIIRPEDGETLRTHETHGKVTVQFQCLNPPTTSNYLLIMREGLCWPQSKPFRHVEKNIWEGDAFFGTAGEHVIHIVTANDLGRAAFEYYRKIVNLNLARGERLRRKFPEIHAMPEHDQKALLGGDYPGIQINGLPKGIRSEAAVRVIIAKSAS